MTMKAVMGNKEPVKSIKHMLGCLSTLPPQIEELNRSVARKGALTVISRCLAYDPEPKPEEVTRGFPELNDDGSDFTEEDYYRCVKESRFAATQLAVGLDLGKYQAAYDEHSKWVTPPSYEITVPTPQRRKHPFDSDDDLSTILTDEDEYHALSKCNCKIGRLTYQRWRKLEAG
ncbi:hypothetical protein ZWY2020_024506 [Hordeum vulgare]|nr:hypothetical protein ZWY2020_024506 [Hordeum vulgare]